MCKSIIIKTDDIRKVLQEIENDHMKYTELFIYTSDDDPEFPEFSNRKCLSISAIASEDSPECVNYDDIYEPSEISENLNE